MSNALWNFFKWNFSPRQTLYYVQQNTSFFFCFVFRGSIIFDVAVLYVRSSLPKIFLCRGIVPGHLLQLGRREGSTFEIYTHTKPSPLPILYLPRTTVTQVRQRSGGSKDTTCLRRDYRVRCIQESWLLRTSQHVFFFFQLQDAVQQPHYSLYVYVCIYNDGFRNLYLQSFRFYYIFKLYSTR